MKWFAISSAVTMDLQVWRMDPNAQKPFIKAHSAIYDKYKYSDPYLRTGGVSDMNICKAISQITGKECFCNLTWTVQQVKEYYEAGSYNVPGMPQWEIESAHAFLKTCIELQLGISFFKI